MLGSQLKTVVKTFLSSLGIYEESVLINKNTSFLQAGLSKHQISNLFSSQGAFHRANIPPLTAIENLAVHVMEKKRAEFYEDCQDNPDPSALDPTQKNLLLLDDCFLSKENKAESYYIRGRHNNCNTIYIAESYFRLTRNTIRENSNFIILLPDVMNLTHPR